MLFGDLALDTNRCVLLLHVLSGRVDQGFCVRELELSWGTLVQARPNFGFATVAQADGDVEGSSARLLWIVDDLHVLGAETSDTGERSDTFASPPAKRASGVGVQLVLNRNLDNLFVRGRSRLLFVLLGGFGGESFDWFGVTLARR